MIWLVRLVIRRVIRMLICGLLVWICRYVRVVTRLRSCWLVCSSYLRMLVRDHLAKLVHLKLHLLYLGLKWLYLMLLVIISLFRPWSSVYFILFFLFVIFPQLIWITFIRRGNILSRYLTPLTFITIFITFIILTFSSLTLRVSWPIYFKALTRLRNILI